MGNRSGRTIPDELQERFNIVRNLSDASITLREDKLTKAEYLVREVTLFRQNDFKQELNKLELKKNVEDPHVAKLAEYLSNIEDMLCSTQHKVYAIYEYPHRNLEQELAERFVQKRRFEEKEIWSILASCILGLSALQRAGIRHGNLRSEQILLSGSGVIQVSDPYCTGNQNNHRRLLQSRSVKNIYPAPQICQSLAREESHLPATINSYKADVFTMGMIVLEMALLEQQHECYKDDFTRIDEALLKERVQQLGESYSHELRVMVDLMLQRDPNDRQPWTQMQSYVRKAEPNFIESQIVENSRKITARTDRQVQSPGKRNNTIHLNQRSVAEDNDKILPVQVSSVAGPRLNAGPSSQYANKVQCDENLVEVSDDETSGERDSGSATIVPVKLSHQQVTIRQSRPKVIQNQAREEHAGDKKIINIGSSNMARNRSDIELSRENSKGPMGQGSKLKTQENTPDVREPVHLQPRNYSRIQAGQPKKDLKLVQASVSKPNIPKDLHNDSSDLMPNSLLRPVPDVYPSSSYQYVGTTTSSHSPAFSQYVPIPSSSVYSAYTQPIDWMNKPAYLSDTKDLFTDYSKLGIQKYQPSTMTTGPHVFSRYDATLPIQTYTSTFARHKIPTSDFKQTQSIIAPSPIRTMMLSSNNNSFASPLGINKDSQSIDITEKAAALLQQVNQKKEDGHESPPRVDNPLSGGVRSGGKGKQQLADPGTPIYVIDHYKQGSRYEGEKVHNLRHGRGKFFYQDGGLYDGQWVRNKMEGRGKLYYQSGKLAYDGEWKDDQFCGKGILYNEFPKSLKTPFDYSDFDKLDDYWTKVEGTFRNDMKEGPGTLYLSNGEYFVGMFEADMVSGDGVYHSMSEGNIRATWRNNKILQDD